MFTNSAKKLLGAGTLALSLAILPASLPAAAQTDQSGSTTTTQETRNDHNSWGWLGLLGLIGLANLLRKSSDRPVAYRDPETPPRAE